MGRSRRGGVEGKEKVWGSRWGGVDGGSKRECGSMISWGGAPTISYEIQPFMNISFENIGYIIFLNYIGDGLIN